MADYLRIKYNSSFLSQEIVVARVLVLEIRGEAFTFWTETSGDSEVSSPLLFAALMTHVTLTTM